MRTSRLLPTALPLLSALPFMASALVATAPEGRYPSLGSRAPANSKAVIVQLFQWNWDSIAAECTNFIGPAGYGYVQVSPAQEHIQGSQWWTDYQPVSYTLTSKRGNQAQYQNMINTCHAAGVKVIADTLLNHMAGISGGTGTAGSSFTHYNYPGLYQSQDFHYCGTSGNQILDYKNSTQVWTCQLSNLADLATESTYVQQTLAGYVNKLLSLGVDGLRLDAAKHINPSQIASIKNKFTSSPYITQEVIWGATDAVQPSQYVEIGDVQEFRYTSALQSAFVGGGISGLQNLDNRGWIAGNRANIFVSNHDTERNGASLSYKSSSNTYTLAHVFSLAHPYGTPSVLSSYRFGGFDDGAPNSNRGTCSDNTGANGWLCQHRWLAISGMVGFRNNVGSAAITNWVSSSSQQIAFSRGSAGFVAINNADSSWTSTFPTLLPDGRYCDVISGVSSAGKCTGAGITVSGGKWTGTVPARGAIAIHTGSKGTGGGSTIVAVTFIENAKTVLGENIFLVGSIPELGSWAPASAIALSSANYPNWAVTVNLAPNAVFQYKFIRKESDGLVVWESDPNRQSTVAASGSQTINSSWR